MDNSKGGLAQTFEAITDAVVKPVGSEVGKMIEVGVKSVVDPTTSDPKVLAQKKAEETKVKQEAIRVIEHYQRLEASQKAVRSQNQQILQEKESQAAKEQQARQSQIVERREKQESIAVTQAKTKTEAKHGAG